MDAVQFHISALKKIFEDLSQGKYLMFFLPGLIVGLLFWPVFMTFSATTEIFSFLEHIPLIGEWLFSLVNGTIGILSFIVTQCFVFFILTLLSPFNALLSERIEENETGKHLPFSITKLLSDMLRMVLVAFICIILELVLSGVYWMFASFTGIHFLDAPAYLLISAFFYGFSFYDFSLERKDKGVFESLNFAFSSALNVTITGIIFLLIYNIPIIGVIVSPVVATMLATHMYFNLSNLKRTL